MGEQDFVRISLRPCGTLGLFRGPLAPALPPSLPTHLSSSSRSGEAHNRICFADMEKKGGRERLKGIFSFVPSFPFYLSRSFSSFFPRRQEWKNPFSSSFSLSLSLPSILPLFFCGEWKEEKGEKGELSRPLSSGNSFLSAPFFPLRCCFRKRRRRRQKERRRPPLLPFLQKRKL